jgi:hypothetical protein
MNRLPSVGALPTDLVRTAGNPGSRADRLEGISMTAPHAARRSTLRASEDTPWSKRRQAGRG